MVLFIVSKIKALNLALFGVQPISAVCSGLCLRFHLVRALGVGAVFVDRTHVYPSVETTGKAVWEPTAMMAPHTGVPIPNSASGAGEESRALHSTSPGVSLMRDSVS